MPENYRELEWTNRDRLNQRNWVVFIKREKNNLPNSQFGETVNYLFQYLVKELRIKENEIRYG